MRNPRSISKSEIRALMLAGVLLLGIGHGWAQLPQEQLSAGDPFFSVDRSLSNAADRALAASMRPSMEGSRNESPQRVVTPEAINSRVNGPVAAISRVQRLQPILEPILREEGVPPELTAVVLVESGGQLNALSRKGARGLWQFMPDTARRYGLIVSRDRDERLDISRSTRAAARYLRDLYSQFGDWQLTFAAYNAGGDRVQRAVEQKQTGDFAVLSSGGSLPLETRRYVPAVIGAMQKLGNASSFLAPPRNSTSAWILYAETRTATNQAEFSEKKGELK